jgi:spore germination protein YaaH
VSVSRGVLAALALLVGLCPLAAVRAQTTSALPAHGRLFLGYYVPYDPTSWDSLQAHPDQLDVVAAQWVTVDACGGLSTRDDQTLKQFAREHGIKLEPSLFTTSGWLDHRLLTDESTRTTALENIVDYTVAEGYDGFDLDLEGVAASDRDALTDFVSQLSTLLHDRDKLLTLALPAKERETTSGWSGAFDYSALSAQADLVTIMAYEYRGPFSGPGSVAPYDWVARVAAYTAQHIAPEKVLLGLAFYGYDWNTTSGGAHSLGFPRAMALAQYVHAEPDFATDQRSLTFAYTAAAGDSMPAAQPAPRPQHTLTSRNAPACDVVPPTPSSAPRPTPLPESDTPQVHEVWVEDSLSAAARIGLVDAHNLRGVAAWRLGFEDPNLWPLLDQWQTLRGSAP